MGEALFAFTLNLLAHVQILGCLFNQPNGQKTIRRACAVFHAMKPTT
jgi:hypothetical protein